ncbi:hypothetical protein GALMADRAFT_931819 [Galerina marginata CBS 339.88]|uniref:F-box domain-containing protein n=1 Tax=Galerina marginata (strain CBS 339.88) TaxID=685588 RepID=A0A067SEK0_GALM3|nr:hypothetical protein GALMADRAFT_931819 [Galerina marginata CBS 339.88]
MALDHISNSSSSTSLPFDVFGVVIDILASETSSSPYFSLKNLMALSFTCHDLLLLCQPYTFKTVNLRANFYLRKVTGKAFYEIPTIGLQEMGLALKRNPRVASYVRNLNLQLSPSDVTGDDLIDILRQFTRLQKLTLTPPENPHYIQGVQHWWADGDEDLDGEGDLGLIEVDGWTYVERYEQCKLDWRDLSPELQNTLRGLIHLPKLTTLKLLLLSGFPTDVLAIATNLQILHVNRCEFVAGFPGEPVPSAGIQLQQVKLRPGSNSNIQMLKGHALPGVPPVLDLSWTGNLFCIFRECDNWEDNIAELAAILDDLSHLETLTLFYRCTSDNFCRC